MDGGIRRVSPMPDTTKIVHHYGQKDIRFKLEAALKDAGLGDGALSPNDLAPLDQFHTRGLAATTGLADVVGVRSDYAVIDVGQVLEGPPAIWRSDSAAMF